MSHPYADDTTPMAPGEEVNIMNKNTPEDLQQLREREVLLWEERGLTHPSKMSPEQFEQFFSDIQQDGGQIPQDLRLVDYEGLQAVGDQPPGTAVVFFDPTTETNGER